MSLDHLRTKYQTELNSLREKEARAIIDAKAGKYTLPPNHWEPAAKCEAKLRMVQACAVAFDEILQGTKDEPSME